MWGFFGTAACRPIVPLSPMSSLHSSPEASHTTLVLGSFTCRKTGTWDRFFHFPSEGRHAEDFSDARKIQRLWPGLNPRTRVPESSMLTTRPPKPSHWNLSYLLQIVVSEVHCNCAVLFFSPDLSSLITKVSDFWLKWDGVKGKLLGKMEVALWNR